MGSVSQRAFAGGEIGPPLYARCDEVKYATGMRTMRNFLVMRHGGAQNRAGTEYIAEVKYSNLGARMIPFEFSDDQTYVLEFGNLYMRVIKNDAYITTSTVAITGIASSGTETIVTTAGTVPVDGTEVEIASVGGMTPVNNRSFVTYAGTGTTFKLRQKNGSNLNSSTFPAYTSGGTFSPVYELVTPYVQTDLPLLKYVQSLDVITMTHNNHATQLIKRFADNNWFIGALGIGPTTTYCQVTLVSNPGGGPTQYQQYAVTATDATTFEEGLVFIVVPAIPNQAVSTAPTTITFNALVPANVLVYNIYKRIGGLTAIGGASYGFIGTSSGGTFVDTGITPDLTSPPPQFRNPYSTDNPGCVSVIQQRLTFGNQPSNIEAINMSQTGRFTNFNITLPSQADDAIQFNMAGRKINAVNHIVDLGAMVIFTANGEFVINGQGEGPIAPGNIVPLQQSYYGSNQMRPIVIGQNALYVQARGNVVRDLGFQFQTQGYTGDDLTIFSPHLFDNYVLVDWDYQQIPNSIVWVARNDGTLLSLTYIKEQQIWGWSRHDFQNNYQSGFVENVCSIPDGIEDAVYLIVHRELNGDHKRYIEKFSTRTLNNIVDYIGMDATLSYDGRNLDQNITMTASSSGGWTSEDPITLTASSTQFTSGVDEGRGINVTGNDGQIIRYIISSVTSGTVAIAFPNRTVPTNQRGAHFWQWTRAVKTLTGLWHIEGQAVSILADGFVIASPNNDNYDDIYTVAGGTINLKIPFGVIHIGLPYVSDLETLDIDTVNEAAIPTYAKRIAAVSAYVQASRGFWAGIMAPEADPQNITNPPSVINPLTNLFEYQSHNYENYDETPKLLTEVITLPVATEYNMNGRVFIRQVDPIPLTILSIIPQGDIPIGGGGKS